MIKSAGKVKKSKRILENLKVPRSGAFGRKEIREQDLLHSDDLAEGKDAPHALVDGIDEPAAVPFPAELLHLVLALLEKVKLGKLLVVQVRLTFHELTLVESPA